MAPRKTTKTPNTEDNYFEMIKRKEFEMIKQKQEKERKQFMKNTGLGAIFVTILVGLIGYFSFIQKVPTGHVGVKAYLYGSSKGIDSEEVGVGKYWIGWNEELYLFPTFTQTDIWSGDEAVQFQDNDGTQLFANLAVSFRVIPEKVNTIFQKFRKGIDEISDVYIRTVVKNALAAESSKLNVDVIYGSGKEKLLSDTLARAREILAPVGIELEMLSWQGAIELPENIRVALNEKTKANQTAMQRQNEIVEEKAKADKEIEKARGQAESISIVAKAQAEANMIIAKSLTPELVQYEMSKRWTGELPRMMGSGAVPFINMNLDRPEKKAE